MRIASVGLLLVSFGGALAVLALGLLAPASIVTSAIEVALLTVGIDQAPAAYEALGLGGWLLLAFLLFATLAVVGMFGMRRSTN